MIYKDSFVISIHHLRELKDSYCYVFDVFPKKSYFQSEKGQDKIRELK